MSARNISTVILYRPDHICQDRFCRDSSTSESSSTASSRPSTSRASGADDDTIPIDTTASSTDSEALSLLEKLRAPNKKV